MFYEARSGRDTFTFSLGGMKTISSFTIAPAVAEDHINKALDERLRRTHDDRPDTSPEIGLTWGRLWLRRRRQAA